jgi:hypothetical protein
MNALAKLTSISIVAILSSSYGINAYAKDVVKDFPITPAMSSATAKQKLGDEVKFYFGDQPHASVEKNYGDIKVSTKTNSFWKEDTEACNWTFLSSLLDMRKQAISLGANAVINITSSFNGSEVNNSSKTYACGTGFLMNGTQFKGQAVKLSN